MQNNLQTDIQYDDEIDLRELFSVLWAYKIKIISITTFFAAVAIIYSLSMPNQYKATVRLAPAQSDDGGLSGTLGQLGGLATLAGVNIGVSESSESQIAQEIMKSWSFVEGFIDNNDLAVQVYAAEGWSKESNELKIDQDAYDSQSKKWLVENDSGVMGPPSSWELFKVFSERVVVSEEGSFWETFFSIWAAQKARGENSVQNPARMNVNGERRCKLCTKPFDALANTETSPGDIMVRLGDTTYG